ncbi:hypothetical protein BDBG_06189 [Blastomyces gilchristii SLH14081]|uniref:BZIP domain-containing protein n=1 Tax=Blastomyces gilchristii (strain SLH14081) TaxID=559298 RepID=A0A179UVX9_BLAGS|nr:uncharacterized protein BDBG_06189 [Blastomyces gilchristii SLH14081]OAT11247.1 hypothetical protein BDBG_06189 [Blastomyces gilchristii SLH14081]
MNAQTQQDFLPTHGQYAPQYSDQVEVEEQISYSGNSMTSDPVTPAPEGFPNVKEFDQLMEWPLIPSKEAGLIKEVLLNSEDTSRVSAKFRDWVKKSFTLKPNNNHTQKSEHLICSNGKPIVIQEKFFKVLTRAHQQCQHKGQTKTAAQARKTYSRAFSASAHPNEDWTKISDLAGRRRIQNRIAQRKYRKKLEQQHIESLKQNIASSSASLGQSNRKLIPASLKVKKSQSSSQQPLIMEKNKATDDQNTSMIMVLTESQEKQDVSMFSDQSILQLFASSSLTFADESYSSNYSYSQYSQESTYYLV